MFTCNTMQYKMKNPSGSFVSLRRLATSLGGFSVR